MSAVATADVVNVFKKVYGKMTDLVSDDYHFQKHIDFAENQKTGEAYIEAVVLTNETGWTILGKDGGNNEINPAIAGAVQQTEVKPYETILASLVPFACISRSAGGGDKAFYAATKHIVKNNLKSHGKLLEILRLYGQYSAGLGFVSYATATYRGVALTNGGGAIDGITFTAGINAASKAILFQPGYFASGIWVGTEGAKIQQVDVATGLVVAEGKLVTVKSEYGYITVDFTPVAATAVGSHKIVFEGQAEAKDAPGIFNILSATGTLFGINTAKYSLWKGNVIPVGGKKFGMPVVQSGVADAVNRGSLDGDLDVWVNPRTWATMMTDQAALRKYDSSYDSTNMKSGAEGITFYGQNGELRIRSSRFVMEGFSVGLHLEDWSRSGSAEISFRVPGSSLDLIFPLQNSTSWAFRSYSDQYVFCNAPAKSILWTGINDESAT